MPTPKPAQKSTRRKRTAADAYRENYARAVLAHREIRAFLSNAPREAPEVNAWGHACDLDALATRLEAVARALRDGEVVS